MTSPPPRHPPGRPTGPTHPTLIAALLMVGIVVFIVVASWLSVAGG